MIQLGRSFRLDLESLQIIGTGQLTRQDLFQGDRSFEADLSGPVDHAHPAPGDLVENLVVAKQPGCQVSAACYGGACLRRLVLGNHRGVRMRLFGTGPCCLQILRAYLVGRTPFVWIGHNRVALTKDESASIEPL